MARELEDAILDHTVGGSIGGQDFESQVAPQSTGFFTNHVLPILDTLPGSPTSMASTAYRGANTIIGGGWADRAARGGFRSSRLGFGPDRGGSIRTGLRNNNPLRPRTWRRYGSQGIFDESGGEGYTPYQFISKPANWIADKTGASSLIPGEGDLIGKGGFARVSAGTRIENMSYDRMIHNWDNIGGFMQKAGYSNDAIRVLEEGGQRSIGEATALSGGGRLTSYGHGVMTGARGGYSGAMNNVMASTIYEAGGAEVEKATTRQAGRYVAAKAGEKVGTHLLEHTAGKLGVEAGELATQKIGLTVGKEIIAKAGLKGAAFLGVRAASAAAWAVPVAGQLLMAYDIANMAVTAVGHGITGSLKMANEGMRSMRGGLSTPIMGGGFRDNSVAQSSRSRGVMAIQNSRLNARSLLGSEGAAMHAHFG